MSQLFEQLEFFHVNKSCKIECCGNKTHQIVQNMILTWGLELKLSLSLRTTISGQHSLFHRWEKAGVPLFPSKYNGRWGSPTFPICKIKNAHLRELPKKVKPVVWAFKTLWTLKILEGDQLLSSHNYLENKSVLWNPVCVVISWKDMDIFEN